MLWVAHFGKAVRLVDTGREGSKLQEVGCGRSRVSKGCEEASSGLPVREVSSGLPVWEASSGLL